jgi:hypothetical protein
VELSPEQDEEWNNAWLQIEEKRKLEEKEKKLKEEQDAWTATVAAVRAKGTAKGQVALEQKKQEDAMLDELELKLQKLEHVSKVAEQVKQCRLMQVAAATLKKTLGGKASKTVVAAAVARAVNEAATSKSTQYIELSFSEARVFLQELPTWPTPEAAPVALSVPKTARAAVVMSNGTWQTKTSGNVSGGEGTMDEERVDLDAFCFPEPTEKLTDEKLDEQSKVLLSKSKLETGRARERYVLIMKAHKDTFCI